MKEIADELGLPASRIRKWKTEDKWDEKIRRAKKTNCYVLSLEFRS
jgi:uncharacterized protein YjcR